MSKYPKILIVDDKVENLVVLETILNKLDVELVRSFSGADALEKIMKHDFALALVDVQMPEMDGFTTVKHIRNVQKTKLLPVIFISAVYSENYYRIKGIQSGAVDFIVKPIIREILLGKVTVFLNLYKEKKLLKKEIDRRRKAEEKLKNNNHQLQLINKILRHDLLNYLTGIKSALYLFEQQKETNFLNEANQRIDNSVALIRNMKELEKLTTSNPKFDIFNIEQVVKKVVENYPQIEFEINGEGKVLADSTLYAVVQNIVENAKIHGKCEKIDIHIEQKGDFCEIKIADNGTGVPGKIKKKIFEEGYSYGEKGKTGLGLFIVKKAVENYGGVVKMKDNNPKGAVFVIMVPIAK